VLGRVVLAVALFALPGARRRSGLSGFERVERARRPLVWLTGADVEVVDTSRLRP
jgi:hypothetical protein